MSTLPVLTTCRFNEENRVEMVVAIRDSNHVIRADLTDDHHNILQVDYDAQGIKDGTCNITQTNNQLDYFMVCRLIDFTVS